MSLLPLLPNYYVPEIESLHTSSGILWNPLKKAERAKTFDTFTRLEKKSIEIEKRCIIDAFTRFKKNPFRRQCNLLLKEILAFFYMHHRLTYTGFNSNITEPTE